MEIPRVCMKVQQGIPDELPGAVIGDIAAPVCRHDIDAAFGELRFACQEVMDIGPGAERVHMFMLGEEQQIGQLARRTPGKEGTLQLPAFAISGPAEPDHTHLSCSHVHSQMLMASPYAAAAASITASLKVGWA